MAYLVKLNHFEGPLDLLLHLIKENEIDIFNIDIFVLTQEYLNYLRLMEFNDLKDATDFLRMAAQLIEIKSRSLLPNENDSETDDDDSIKDKEQLQEILIARAEMLEAVPLFESRFTSYQSVHTNFEWKRLQPFYEDVQQPLRMEVASLVVLYEHLLRTLPDKKAVKVEAKLHKVSIDEKIQELTILLNKLKFALFQGFYTKFASRYELVVYILSVLEMVRWGKLNMYQQEMKGPIWLYLPNFKVEDLPLTREQKATLLENNYPISDEKENVDKNEGIRTIQGATVKDVVEVKNKEDIEDIEEDIFIENEDKINLEENR